jgi:tetratricopeptide (TPR) repeat protein
MNTEPKGIRKKFSFPAFYIGLVINLLTLSSLAADNHEAWDLLMNNKPIEAKSVFESVAAGKDINLVKDALIGLAFTEFFLGNDREASRYYLESCLKQFNPVEAYNGFSFRMDFVRQADLHTLKEGYNFYKIALQKSGLFNGSFSDELIERYMADGKIGEAQKISKEMGAIRTWQCIGPFENISNSGYNICFPPEKNIDYTKKYIGKDGNEVCWFPITVQDPRGWLFMNQHTISYNSVYYFYTNVESPAECKVRLAFGASGAFKIFLNDQTVIADSIFRNTGNDVYMQTVTLHKGANSLLIKIGHEGRQTIQAPAMSNFLLRIIDNDFKPLNNLRYSSDPKPFEKGKDYITNLRPMPVVDSAAAYLQEKLKRNPQDMGSALLRAMLYNYTENTDSAQIICTEYLKRYPNSSIWYTYYSEALQRAHKTSQMQTVLKKAYQLSKLNYSAWNNELSLLRETNNPQKILDFISASNPLMQNTVSAHIMKMSAYAIMQNQTGFFNELSYLENNWPLDYEAVSVLFPLYSKVGLKNKAVKIISNYLKHDHTNAEFHESLVNLAFQDGNMNKALSIIDKWRKILPDNVTAAYDAAYVLYANKQYQRALENINYALMLMPAYSNALNLKGDILTSSGKTEEASSVYKETIAKTSDDFTAWENLRLLQHKPSLDSLVPLPSIESLIKQSRTWDKKNSESGSIISYINDLFYYPSHCSRERRFFVVYLPNQNAVDQWKEYNVSYNDYYQTASISRALSYSSDGAETPADINNGQVVFKSLKPGDYILLEFSIQNYYAGKMAKQVFGTEDFQISYPIYNHQFRIITPVNDTIPYKICGDSLKVTSSVNGDYRITSFVNQSKSADNVETFVATDWEGKREVSYSTLSDWNYIAVWYNELTHHKSDNSIELSQLADSLFAGVDKPIDKVRRIHDYIVSNIRYSFVPFRQSGWIPQSATDVLASRIGDCKDMASLAQHLLERAGVNAHLVLVNTEMRNCPANVPISPEFNHCIVAFTIDNHEYFMDCTSEHLNFGNLPEADQGAIALIINDSTQNLISLPIDSSFNRLVRRTSEAYLDSSMTLKVSLSTIRTGTEASGIRYNYRYLSKDDQRQTIHRSVSQDYTQIALDSLKFEDLSLATDTVKYYYKFTAKNAAMVNGSTVSLPVRFVDHISSKDFPVEEKRTTPIDMAQSLYGIGTFEETKTIHIPQNLKMLVVPKPVKLESPWGSYRLDFTFNKSVITITRNASFKFYSTVPSSKMEQFKAFMSKIAESDAMQLLFEKI